MKSYKLLILGILVLALMPSLAKSQVSQLEFEALKALYKSTDGDNWTNNTGWDTTLTANDVNDSWYGLSFHGITGKIKRINLANNNLTGEIPKKIENLTSIKDFWLNGNTLSGNIPPEIGGMSSLYSLRLNSNMLSGAVPSELNNTNIKEFNLSGNALEGELPVYSCDYTLVSNNKFTSIPFIDGAVLSCEFNNLAFESLEYNIAIDNFQYSPQAKIGIPEIYEVLLGENKTISVSVGGTANTYQWYKDDIEIIGATETTYTVSNFVLEDVGTYICKINNTIATELELVSHDITLVQNCLQIPTITAQTQSTPQNSNFTTSISTSTLTEDCNIIAYQFKVEYDHNNIEFVDSDISGTLSFGGSALINSNIPGELIIGFASFSSPLSGTGELIKLNFKSLNCESSPITLSDFLYNSTPNTNLINGNVSVVDNTDPFVSFIGNKNINTDFSVCTYTHNDNTWDPVINDNCSSTTLDTTLTLTGVTTVLTNSDLLTLEGQVFNKGLTIVTWEITDETGNETILSYNVNVTDNEMPVINCVSDVENGVNSGTCTYEVQGAEFDATFTDNCSPVGSISNNYNSLATLSGELIPTGTHNILWTATDASGKISTCTTVITIKDDEFPTAICRDVDIFLLQDGTVNITPATLDDGSSDFCNFSLSVSQTTFNCNDIGDNLVDLTITDASNNTDVCTSTVTVYDDLSPVISAIPTQTYSTDVGECYFLNLTNNWDLVIDENCESFTYNVTLTGATSASGLSTLNGVTFNKGTTTVEWTAEDVNGNISNESFNVIIEDKEAPSLICPTDQEIANTINCDKRIADFIDIVQTVTDNCTDGGDILITQTPAAGEVYTSSTVVNITATDESGNSSVCNFFIPEVFVVTNTNNNGVGSLHAVIDSANTCPVINDIEFNIQGTAPHEITLTSVLPTLQDITNIDANTQPGSGTHKIIVDGTNLMNKVGFEIEFSDIHISNIQIEGFKTGVQDLGGNSNFTASNCIILNPAETGVSLIESSNSLIEGGEISGASTQGVLYSNTVNCELNDVKVHGNDKGINIINNSEVDLIGNEISNNSLMGINIENNSSTVLIKLNNINENAEQGILITDSENITSTYSIITKNSLAGIEIDGGDDITIKENTIGENFEGIKIIAFNDQIDIKDNYIGTNDQFENIANDSHGILVEQNINLNNPYIINISDNRVWYNLESGIFFANANGTTGCTQNSINYNGVSGIFLENGAKNTFSKNTFQGNAVKSIDLNVNVNSGNWENESKKAPFVTKTELNSGVWTVTVVSEDNDANIELFAGNGTNRQDALKYIGTSTTQSSYITWVFSNIPDDNYSHFTATATDSEGNTSEMGYEIDFCLEVVSEEDEGFGTFRHAIGCANEYPDSSHIWFGIDQVTDAKTLSPHSEYPAFYTPVYIDGTTQEIALNGANLNNGNNIGLTFIEKTDEQIIIGTTIEEMTITGFTHGISSDNHFDLTIDTTVITDSKSHAVLVESTSGLVKFLNSETSNSQGNGANAGSGVKVLNGGAGNLRFENHIASNNTGSGISYLDENGNKGNSDLFLTVKESEFSNNEKSGVKLGNNISGDIKIQNSRFIENTENGITFECDSASGVITGNSFTNNHINGFLSDNDAEIVTISGNSVVGNTDNGIKVTGGTLLNEIRNNTIGNSSNGIYIESSKVKNISSNYIGLSTQLDTISNTSGIYIESVTDTIKIFDNTIGFNTGDGIYVKSAGLAHIYSNFIGAIVTFSELEGSIVTDIGNYGNGIFALTNAKLLIGQAYTDTSSVYNKANYIGFNDLNGVVFETGDINANMIGATQYLDSIGNRGTGIENTASSGTGYIKSNFIGYNGGHGINGANGGIIEENIIGGYETGNWGNGGWGITGSNYTQLKLNSFGYNSEGGLKITGDAGRIAECLFFGCQPYPILLTSNQKTDFPEFNSGDPTSDANQILLKGTANANDSIEVFMAEDCGGATINATKFVGKTIADNQGTWELLLFSADGNWSQGIDMYYAATATKESNNNTSEFSAYKYIEGDCSPCVVVNNNDDGPGSLRAAIEKANSETGSNDIIFNIPEEIEADDEYEINLFTPLPIITEEVYIQGASQQIFNGTLELVEVSGNFIRDTIGIYIGSSNNVKVEKLKFSGLSRGIQTTGSATNVQVYDCYFEDSDSSAILLDNTQDAKIYDNTFADNNGTAITNQNAASTLIESNSITSSGLGVYGYLNRNDIISENNIFENMGRGILQENTQNLTINNNEIISNYNDAIKIDSTFTCDITENYIGTNISSELLGNTGHGIAIVDSVANVTISGNTIGNSGRAGIYISVVEASSGMKIENNFIGVDANDVLMGNTGDGVQIDTAQNVSVLNNSIAYNRENGILLFYGKNNRFSKNRIFNNRVRPISIDKLETEWGNNEILTPSIAHVEYNESSQICSVVVKSNEMYDTIELFAGENASFNAHSFITDDLTNMNNGFWEASFPWAHTDSLFFTVSAHKGLNSSEIGASCLIVTNTRDKGLGALRDAIECANYNSDESTIVFDVMHLASKTIIPENPLPSIFTPVNIEPNSIDTIVINGENLPDADGLIFSTNPTKLVSSRVKNIKISGFQNGISIDGHDRITISNMEITNNSVNGIIVEGATDSVKIFNNQIVGNSGSGVLIDSADKSYLKIFENRIEDNTKSGIDYSSLVSDSSIISGNLIFDNDEEGVLVNPGAILYELSKNHIAGNGLAGIKSDNSIIYSVTNNTVGFYEGDTIAIGNAIGIEINNSLITNISNNVIVGNSGDGIYLNSQPTKINIFENYIGIDTLFRSFHTVEGTSEASSLFGNQGNGIWGESATNLNIFSNFIGNSGGNGILGCDNSVINSNKIGGVSDALLFGNSGAGLSGGNYSSMYRNSFADNAQNGLVLNTSDNQIIECLYFGNQEKAIDLPADAVLPASFIYNETGYLTYPDSLVLNGTCETDADTIELFFGNTKSQSAIRFIKQFSPNDDNTWKVTIPSGPNYNYYGANFYANTVTDANFRTSELSDSIAVMFTLCQLQNDDMPFLQPEDRDTTSVCVGDYKRIDGRFTHLTYEWVHVLEQEQDTVWSNSQITEFSTEGTFALTVTDLLGCQVSDTITLEVLDEVIQPDFLMASSAGVNDRVVLVEMGWPEPDSISWDFGDAVIIPDDERNVISFYSEGTYDITLTSYVGTCDSSVTYSIVIGAESKAFKDGFVYPNKIVSAVAYPNPVQNILAVDVVLTEPTGLYFTVTNNNGITMQNSPLISNVETEFTQEIDFSGYKAGTYYVHVSGNNADKRIIKVIKYD